MKKKHNIFINANTIERIQCKKYIIVYNILYVFAI